MIIIIKIKINKYENNPRCKILLKYECVCIHIHSVRDFFFFFYTFFRAIRVRKVDISSILYARVCIIIILTNVFTTSLIHPGISLRSEV